jgi:Zn-dependent peptidase ImmA (M78 family)/transcriptional regulator with XRE-family HTH domain
MSHAPARFIPERLREGREARGLSAQALADALGVTRQAVAQFEVGQASPSGQTFDKIVNTLKQPPAFFTTPRMHAREASGTIFWRSLKRMHRSDRDRIARRLDWLQDIVSYLEQFIEFPPVHLPAPQTPPEANDVGTIEETAALVRTMWGLGRGPIPDVVGLLEAHGIIVTREALAAPGMDAVSRWQCGRPVILLSSDKNVAARSRFDAAHELGHITLHSGVEIDSSNLTKIEAQADRFAGAFLLPAESFTREVMGTSIDHFVSLKRRWKVSIAAMVYRCKDLGIFTRSQIEYLWRQIAARNMRKIEPVDRELEPERPKFIAHAVKMMLDHGIQGKQDFKEKLLLHSEDLERLCGLEPGSLEPTVVPLKIKPRADHVA